MARIIAARRQALFRHRLRDELPPSRAQEHASLLVCMDLSSAAPGHAIPPVPTITNEEMAQFFDFDAYERDRQAAMGDMEEVVSALGPSMVEPMPAAPVNNEQDISYVSSPATDPNLLHSAIDNQSAITSQPTKSSPAVIRQLKLINQFLRLKLQLSPSPTLQARVPLLSPSRTPASTLLPAQVFMSLLLRLRTLRALPLLILLV